MDLLKNLGTLLFVLALFVVSGCSGMVVKSNSLAKNDSKESFHVSLAYEDSDYRDWD